MTDTLYGPFTGNPVYLPAGNQCHGEYEFPDGSYMASWDVNTTSGMITFHLAAALPLDSQHWMAIGMNSERKMVRMPM